MMRQLSILASFLLLPSLIVANHDIELERTVLEAQIPKPLSDHTASLAQDNLVYIAGGCDDPNGNTFDANASFFTCGSVSDSFYSFNPETKEFKTLPNLPSPRYRHASAAVNNQIWIVGGRSLEDGLLTDVNVFDIATQSWTTVELPEEYATSDLAGWATATHAYFAGGYTANYTAQTTVFSIDVSSFGELAEPEVIRHADLKEARGDVAATVNLGTGYAYIGGGFSHENNFCRPLESVERYSLDGDTWIKVASLPTARADKVMVTLEDHIISMGGERQDDNICDIDNPSPGELTLAVDDIEVLNDDDSTWEISSALPETRFRFAAVAYKNTIYTFGGQHGYDETCNCLKTTNEVVTYVDVSPDEDAGDVYSHEDGDHDHHDDTKDEAATTNPPGASVTDDSGATSFSTMTAGLALLLAAFFS
ncbi:kelch-like [Seminavis robusta]|uniref:Kelch-like n=1 Tax=Seminavis robusta TaxID=568900 RepID=A0A9N8EM41_9STRA|nr:kelch-like [Seminavis robusta]|eukprot:Sro1440_g272820.1 kelch-like (423) ;mRNA; f:3187-4572